MTIKRIYLVLCICVIFFSGKANTFEIRGTYSASDGTELFLIDLQDKDTLMTTKVKDNRFFFKGELVEPIYAYVGEGRNRIHLILESGTVAVDLDERTSQGTPLTDAYTAFHKRFYAFDALRKDERKNLTAIKDSITLRDFNQRWEQINDKYRQLQGQLTDSIVRANNDNLFGAMALDDMASRDTALFMQLYQEMSAKMQSVAFLHKDAEYIRLQSRTAPGKMFIDYLIKGGNLDGTDIRLSDYVGKGKYILLDHWASWCGPCKAEIPYIKKTWEDFAGELFDVVSVAVNDKREKTLTALSQLDMPWHQIVDAQDIPTKLYNITAIPRIILFAPDGTILKNGLREEQIYTTVNEILSQKLSHTNHAIRNGKVVDKEVHL